MGDRTLRPDDYPKLAEDYYLSSSSTSVTSEDSVDYFDICEPPWYSSTNECGPFPRNEVSKLFTDEFPSKYSQLWGESIEVMMGPVLVSKYIESYPYACESPSSITTRQHLKFDGSEIQISLGGSWKVLDLSKVRRIHIVHLNQYDPSTHLIDIYRSPYRNEPVISAFKMRVGRLKARLVRWSKYRGTPAYVDYHDDFRMQHSMRFSLIIHTDKAPLQLTFSNEIERLSFIITARYIMIMNAPNYQISIESVHDVPRSSEASLVQIIDDSLYKRAINRIIDSEKSFHIS